LPLEQETSVLALKKRSFSVSGHRTSVALEAEFWAALDAAARDERMPLASLIARVDATRGDRPLASALRVYALLRALGRAAPSL
jgi:predicted DNA-binding ribbon-helix-helix protein